MAMADNTRKRKQEFVEPKPINTCWSDFVYSSPNSPQQQQNIQQQQQQNIQHQQQDFNLDTIFHNQHDHRRHSVSVGDMQFHSLDKLGWNNNELEQLLTGGSGNSLPSSWSSSSSMTVDNGGNGNNNNAPIIHRRAMSLRLDNLPIHHQQHSTEPIDMHRASISTASPTTPAFFSPSFLDALKQDDEMMVDNSFESAHHFSDDLIHDFMMNQQQQQQQQQQSTITPSVISTGDEVNNLTNWLLNQPPTITTTKRKSCSSSSSSSTSPLHNASPSPPATTTSIQTYQQQHPSIPEEEDEEDIDLEARNRNKQQLDISSRVLQGTHNASTLKPLVQKYLLTFENERKITILTSKVAQKSYGTEKRFLCPPPSTVLSGTSSWWSRNLSDTKLNAPSLVVHISGEKTSQNGVIEWYNTTTGSLLDTSCAVNSANNGDTNLSGNCVSKHLHINDADEKRKRVEVLVKINLGNGIHLGTFASKGIKVISKPSKKRQSVKNMELCIHHGTTISLFNRIRSQTVSTKYLGVSTAEDKNNGGGTCFVARTGSWDPFVIWIVDTSRSPDTPPLNTRNHHPDNPHFPAPPAIALHTTTGQQPIALHYNQAVVLQCVSTGLVSPVMVIRKVDKGSMIMGGNRLGDLSGATGGECGDEALGDPVSQLHKIAFQIVQDPSIAHNNKANFQPHPIMALNQLNTSELMLPQTSQAVTYLACLNDVVGMHKTTTERSFVVPRTMNTPIPQQQQPATSAAPSSSMDSSSSSGLPPWSDVNSFGNYDLLSSVVSHQENGKVTRKRRVSCDVNLVKPMSLPKYPTSSISTNSLTNKNRRRVNSLNDGLLPTKTETGAGRRSSTSSHDRRSSIGSDGGLYQVNGACWTEDVSDASVWTIVGTDSLSYKFWTPPPPAIVDLNSPFSSSVSANSITPFPILSSNQQLHYNKRSSHVLNLTGENFTRDVSIWFGDIKSPRTEYKARDSISCNIPDIQELLDSPVSVLDPDNAQIHKIPLLFVRGDGVIYNTDMFYTF
ncbi:hypothetical protein EDC94DRAFT_602740 [Helicostylum pulchrum]|nr:hypothetical protein EDC94DRAFT_602740 [Helicostylum pulchrum]